MTGFLQSGSSCGCRRRGELAGSAPSQESAALVFISSFAGIFWEKISFKKRTEADHIPGNSSGAGRWRRAAFSTLRPSFELLHLHWPPRCERRRRRNCHKRATKYRIKYEKLAPWEAKRTDFAPWGGKILCRGDDNEARFSVLTRCAPEWDNSSTQPVPFSRNNVSCCCWWWCWRWRGQLTVAS